MEDLLAKFYGKPESEGSAGVPGPDEAAPRLEPESQPEHSQQLGQRVGLLESQLLQMAKAQQAILSRLDTMIDQQESQPAPQESQQQYEPPPAPKQAWRPAWKEPRPEPQPKPQAPSSDDDTPLVWDHILDDASEDDSIDHKPWNDPSQQERPSRRKRSADTPTRTCTICGRQFPLHKGKMVRATGSGPSTLHCPQCFSAHQTARTPRIAIRIAVLGVLGVIFLITMLTLSNKSKPTNNPPRMDFPTRPTSVPPQQFPVKRFPVRRRK
jgi:hypothetical protein